MTCSRGVCHEQFVPVIRQNSGRIPTTHQHLPDAPRRQIVRPAFKAVFQFARFMITLPVVLIRGRRGNIDEVTVYSAHPSFFLWLLILVGFVSAAIVHRSPDWAGFFGWFYVWVMLYFLVMLLYDFSARKLGLWVLIFALIWLAVEIRRAAQEHRRAEPPVRLSRAACNPKLDPGTATVLSWLLLLPWIGSLLHMALNGRKKFTPNEIGEFHFGEGSELTDRSGLRFRTKYRDVLETILTFGGGDLLAVDNHQNVIKRWDNIIGLFFFWKDLDRVLHQRAAVMDSGDGRQGQEVAADRFGHCSSRRSTPPLHLLHHARNSPPWFGPLLEPLAARIVPRRRRLLQHAGLSAVDRGRGGGPWAPIAAGGVVLVTFLLALPVYWYVVGRATDGRGATGLLEDSTPAGAASSSC